MNTPTPIPTPRTDAATYPADCLGKTLVTHRDCSRALETELGAVTGAYTCTHHNDQMRAACPVCIVATLTAERDQLRAALALGQQNCDAVYDELRGDCDELRGDVVRLAAERDQLRAVFPQICAAIGNGAFCTPTVSVGFIESIPHEVQLVVAELRARAIKAEAAETVALAKWNGALERAMKAEADLVALGQCHDDNCRGVVKIAADLAIEREKAERYRLASLKLDAELATERARLDWVFRNCKVTADDYTTGNRDVYAIHDREDLGAAMKEDAK
jgi:hypothetical protein